MKKYVAGLVIVFLLFTTTSVYAQSVKQFVLTKINYTLIVQGKSYSNDSQLPALNLDGHTYVPLKAIGDWLGVSVNWNNDKHQVEVGMDSSSNMKPEQLSTRDVLVGAQASPPMGDGNGMLLLAQASGQSTVKIPLTEGVNGFRIATDGNMAYVPTLQGKTYVINLLFHSVEHVFDTPKGARIADISKKNNLLLITGPKTVTAYSLDSLQMEWQYSGGGNTLAIVDDNAYLSGNNSQQTDIIDLKSGKTIGTLPIGHIEDSVYDPGKHTLWLANWSTGDMTVLDTDNNKVIKVIHEEEGGGFNMSNMMMSSSGFMQLAVSPDGNHVYAASFSGNIMVYDAGSIAFEKDIATLPGAKLSGLAVSPSGEYVYTTVENKNETVAVSMKTDKIVASYPGFSANRWFVMQ